MEKKTDTEKDRKLRVIRKKMKERYICKMGDGDREGKKVTK